MNKRIIMLMAAALALLSAGGQVVNFTNWGEYKPIEISLSDNQTSLNKVFVVYDTDGVGMTYTASTDEIVVWKDYNDEPIGGVIHEGPVTRLPQVIPNKGYKIVEGNSSTHYYWVVNYADYRLELNDLFCNNESECDLVTLTVDGHGDAIPYYEVNGQRQVLDREIKLTYNTLVWKEDSLEWRKDPVIETFASLDQGIEIIPPLCDTELKMTGDRFLEQWELVENTEGNFNTHAVSSSTIAYYLDEQGNYILDEEGNKTKLDGDLTGGSAPLRILFTGYPTDKYECNGAVVYRVWEMARDQDFEDIILQYNQDEVDYTFYDAGNYYMRYMVANDDGSCDYYSDTYTINVSESELMDQSQIPNVFTPNGDGSHDVWKVKSKSLVEFHCWIFNRWGTLIYEFTDPDSGWDGTWNGRYVDTGVYYYVLTATGSDGTPFQRRGDITVLRYSGTSSSGAVDNGGVINE